MNIIICGAGEVGRYTAEVLDRRGDHITMIDLSSKALGRFEEDVDVRALQGSCCYSTVLKEAGVERCDVLVAATQQDEINLLTAAIAKRMGAGKVLVRIHHRTYLNRSRFDYAESLEIDHLICPEYLTAMHIARTLYNPGAMAIERFAQDQVEMQQYAVNKDSQAIGVKLIDLELPPGIRLATIRRNDNAYIPSGTSMLEAEDVVTVIGDPRHSDKVSKMFGQLRGATQKIVIMGGTTMGVWLARAMANPRFSVRLFETDRARAEELSDKLGHVTILQADPTDPTVFSEEHLDQCDAFIGVSEDDEHNILGALQAKSMGAEKTGVVVKESTYLRLLGQLGVDHPFSPRIEAAKELLKLIDDAPVRRMATLEAEVAELFELSPARTGTAIDQPLKSVKLPKGSFVAAIQRNGQVRVPGGDDAVQVGDVLIAIGPAGIEKKLRDLFVGR